MPCLGRGAGQLREPRAEEDVRVRECRPGVRLISPVPMSTSAVWRPDYPGSLTPRARLYHSAINNAANIRSRPCELALFEVIIETLGEPLTRNEQALVEIYRRIAPRDDVRIEGDAVARVMLALDSLRVHSGR